MTTIAFRDGVMACDSCWGNDETVDTFSTKIMRLKSGALLGQAGTFDWRPVAHLLQNVKTWRAVPNYAAIAALRVDIDALLVFPRTHRMVKLCFSNISLENWTGTDAPDVGAWEIDGGFTAIGSGRVLALGAMEAGASSRRAVQIACRRDMNSRPPVHTLQFARGKK